MNVPVVRSVMNGNTNTFLAQFEYPGCQCFTVIVGAIGGMAKNFTARLGIEQDTGWPAVAERALGQQLVRATLAHR